MTLTSNIRTGRHFHANLYSYVEHDCVVGDFATLAPRVQCNGNIVIEDHAYIGTEASIRQGQPGKPLVSPMIGREAVVTRMSRREWLWWAVRRGRWQRLENEAGDCLASRSVAADIRHILETGAGRVGVWPGLAFIPCLHGLTVQRRR